MGLRRWHTLGQITALFQASTLGLGFCAHLNFGEIFLASQLIDCCYIKSPRRRGDQKRHHLSGNGLKMGGYCDTFSFRSIDNYLFAKAQLS